MLVLAIIPFLERFFVARVAILSGLTAIFVVGTIVNRRRPMFLIPAIGIAVFAIPITWATLFIDHSGLFVVSCVLGSLFFAMTAIAILVEVVRHHLATVQSIVGATCVYLLLGLTWAMLYWGVDRVDTAALDIPHRRSVPYTVDGREVTAFSQMVYFSFVTMSTLGYGDISPTKQLTETLAWLQSVVGQFYLAVLVARLVSALAATKPEDGN
jgi:uncharacterized membrane protein